MNSASPARSSASRAARLRTALACGACAALVAASGACGRIGFTLLDLPPADAGPEPGHDASMADVATSLDSQARDTSAGEADTQPPEPEAEADAQVDGEAGVPDDDAAPDAGPDSGDAGCVTSTIVNYCTALPMLPAPPVIDGVLDCGPALLPIVPVAWSGPGVVPAGNSAKVAT